MTEGDGQDVRPRLGHHDSAVRHGAGVGSADGSYDVLADVEATGPGSTTRPSDP